MARWLEAAATLILALKNEDSFFVSDAEVGAAVFVEVGDGELGADAGVAVEEMGDEFNAVFTAFGFEPIDDSRTVGAGVPAVVGPVAFAGGEVGDAVAIEVAGGEGVSLGEAEPFCGRLVAFRDDDVLLKRDLAVDEGVFIPGQSPGVRPEAGDDVVVAVSIDIKDEHLCAAGVGEFIVMEGPLFAGSGIFGAFIPSSFFEEVGAAVAIEIAEAEAVVVG